jgi:hypothetical protein
MTTLRAPKVSSVKGVTYYECGQSYMQAYSSSADLRRYSRQTGPGANRAATLMTDMPTVAHRCSYLHGLSAD